ncbi:FeS cluster assembly protein SufD [Spirochaetota bacterium]|nr:FeS cluster assembly protein SufD [Spirochaetota bacterium]
MTTCTRFLNKTKSEERIAYGTEQFARFKQAIQSLNIEKDDYWKHSNVNFFNKIEKKQPKALLTIKDKGWPRVHSRKRSDEKLTDLIAKTSEKIYPVTSVEENNLAYTLVFNNGALLLKDSNLSSESMLLEVETNETDLSNRYPKSIHSLVKQNHNEPNLMLSLNIALTALQEGLTSEQHEVFIRIPKNVTLAKPLVCLFLDDSASHEKIIIPRVHLHLEQNAALTFLETHKVEHVLLQNTFINITLEAGAKLIHVQELEEGANVNHIHMTHGNLYHNSSYYTFSMQHGSQSSLIEKKFFVKGEGANASFNGLSIGKTRQHFNNIVSLHHETEQTTSQQNYKFVLADRSRGAFTGHLKVFRNAQGVNAGQLCKTLLIGEKSVMYARPQLEIFADDVKCGHGATIGEVNAEELFYLMSRGISQKQALAILSHAFVKEFFINLAEVLGHPQPAITSSDRSTLPTENFLKNFF